MLSVFFVSGHHSQIIFSTNAWQVGELDFHFFLYFSLCFLCFSVSGLQKGRKERRQEEPL